MWRAAFLPPEKSGEYLIRLRFEAAFPACTEFSLVANWSSIDQRFTVPGGALDGELPIIGWAPIPKFEVVTPVLVVVESPYAGKDAEELERNRRYLAACLQDCKDRGEIPYASHGLFPQFFPDSDPPTRARDMEAGFIWGKAAGAKAHVYADLGVTQGMAEGAQRALAEGRLGEVRFLPSWAGQAPCSKALPPERLKAYALTSEMLGKICQLPRPVTLA